MKINHSNLTSKYPLILGGLTTAAGLAYLYYRWAISDLSSVSKLSNEQVKKILKEFRREYYPILKQLKSISNSLQNDYKQRFNYIPDNIKKNLNTILIDENPTFKEKVQLMEDHIYEKYHIKDGKAFEELTLKLAETDPEIRNLVNEIKEALNKAVNGIGETYDIPIPEEISAGFILKAYGDMIKLSLQQILSYVKEYKRRYGEITISDERFVSGMKDLHIDQIKAEFLKDKGFEINEDYHPEQVFEYALEKYCETIEGYESLIKSLEALQQNIIKLIMPPNLDIEQAENELQKIDRTIGEAFAKGKINSDQTVTFEYRKQGDNMNDADLKVDKPVEAQGYDDVNNKGKESMLYKENKIEEGEQAKVEEKLAEPLEQINPDIEEDIRKEEVHIEPVSWINIKKDESIGQSFFVTEEPINDEKILTESTLRDPEFKTITLSTLNNKQNNEQKDKNETNDLKHK